MLGEEHAAPLELGKFNEWVGGDKYGAPNGAGNQGSTKSRPTKGKIGLSLGRELVFSASS